MMSTVSLQNEPLDLSQKQDSLPKSLPKRLWKPKSFDFDGFFSTQVKRFTANDVCNSRCQMLYKDHYHCFAENGNCLEVMKGKDQLRQHGKRHSVAEELTNVEFKFCLKCHIEQTKSHYHCSYVNCAFVSSQLSNLHRLAHVESVHCSIVLKRANGNNNKNRTSAKRSKIVRENPDIFANFLSVSDLSNPLSPISSGSCENQFIDLNNDPIDQNRSTSLINCPSSGKLRLPDPSYNSEEIENSILLHTKDEEKHLYKLGTCARLFCNLKKADHYHCPVCDVGCSKIDLYIRHLKRHK